MNIAMKNGSIIINGQSYTGSSFVIDGGKIIIDGKQQDGAPLAGPISVVVNGDCAWIELGSGSISVAGRVRGDVKTGSGSVRCGDVEGNIHTGSGDVSCGVVAGSVKTGSGDISLG